MKSQPVEPFFMGMEVEKIAGLEEDAKLQEKYLEFGMVL